MTKPYVSSIMSPYGDAKHVPRDVKTLNEIMTRQGARLLIDVVAEYAGTFANSYRISSDERGNLIESLITDLRSALEERL